MSKAEQKLEKLLDTFKKQLEIDRHELDEELNRQPQVFQEVSEQVAYAQAERDYAKENLSRVDAELGAKHRKKIEKSGVRATEALVNTAVLLDPLHEKAVNRRIEAQKRLELLIGVKDSFNQRSYMVRDMCSLFVANYFEKNSVSGSSSVKDVKAEKIKDKMAEKRRKRQRE